MKLSKLLQSLVILPDGDDVDITLVTADSRKVKAGTLFVACKGATPTSFDGHTFLIEAERQGAVAVVADASVCHLPALNIPIITIPNSSRVAAVLIERFYGLPSQRLKVAAVTGTNGKSSVTFLLSGILNSVGQKSAVIGTLGAGPLSNLKSTGLTTPSSEALSQLLQGFVEEQFTHVCMEASSHALHSHRLDGVQIEAAAFTNLSEDHLDYHGDMKSYREAKERLFLELLPTGKCVVLPYGDPMVGQLQNSHKVIEWLPFDLSRHADNMGGAEKKTLVRATVHSMGAEGMHLTLAIGNERAECRTPLFGTFHVDNLLVAAGLAHALGLSIQQIAQGLANAPNIPGRLERIEGNIFVDFAHTPDGLLRALQALRPFAKRLIVVFGCGGDRDKLKRPLMGAIAASHADSVIVTSDNPRSEDPSRIMEDIVAGVPGHAHVKCIVDRRMAMKEALLQAKDGDVVLIAGKGHERTLDIGNQKIPFYDPDVAREILKEYRECNHSHSLS